MAEVESIEEFVALKGGVGLLCVINPLGSRFTDLDDKMVVSPATLEDRLEEAQELGLVVQTEVEGRGMEPLALYVPTERGLGLYHEVRARGILWFYEAWREATERFAPEVDAFERYVRQNEDRIMDASETIPNFD